MTDENKWEYDYSSLYRQNGGAPQEGTGYVNVGSSGNNAANQEGQTVQPNPADFAQAPAGGVHFEQSYTQPGGTVPPQTPPASGNAAPHNKRPRKHHDARGIASRVLTIALAGVVGFGGGVAGSMYASRNGGNGHVVMHTVQRPDGGTAITSTGGKNLSMTEVAKIVSPSVAVITTEKMVASRGGWYDQNRVISGAGSGVVMTEDGYIMTNAHVVAGASYITVTLGDKDYPATLIGEDTESDIAVVKIEANDLVPAVMGDSDTLAVGEIVVAVGNPLGELGGTVTDGIVSALNRSVMVEGNEMSLIQTSASVSPGNSGGGLFNMQGELIGVVNAKSSGDNAEGLGFAIPVNTARDVAASLIENGYVNGRPAMGVTIVEVNSPESAEYYGVNSYGVYIYAIEDGSAAAQAGLKPGDRILSVGDVEVTDSNTLTNYIKGYNVGDTINLTVARKGKAFQVELVLGERSAPAAETPEQQTPPTQN